VEQYYTEVRVFEELKKVKTQVGARMINHGVCSTGHFYIIMFKYGLSLKEMLRYAKA
jgi:hypothetical protein